ncbi:MAG TPA: Trm112 family protein [Candidatus Dormibacteraeota bacterium]|jgi:hypothetical protein|nr:Trm112 family protein [Candidatus Dormibacteraeota bacterium]
MISADLLAVLACPKCHSKLTLHEADLALDCEVCHLRYRIDNGIPVMLVEEATPIS